MNRIAKFTLFGLVALLVAVLAGWWWGRSGRGELDAALSNTRLRLALSEARANVLAARVSLYNLNFGDASRLLDDAKAPLRQAQQQLDESGLEGSEHIATALSHVEDAQKRAGRLDQAANGKAGEAVAAIDEAARTVPLPPATAVP